MPTYKRPTLSIWLLALMTTVVSFVSAGKNDIDGVRIWPYPSSSVIVFDLSEPAKYSYFTLSQPDRLVIDLQNTTAKFDFQQITNNSQLIKKIRHSTAKNKQSIRVVIELSKKLQTKVSTLTPAAPYGDRLMVELSDKDKPPPQVMLSTQTGNSSRDIIVVVDAGHGGPDPGSIGSAGSHEKDVTLSVARKLAALINKEPGMQAIMTRTGDDYISPNKRPALARKHKADLFVSIHADAFTTPQPSGASVWVLSVRRANTELGRWMEKTERHSELLGGAAEVIQDTVNERYLTEALLDMSMDHSMTTSYDLGRLVLKQLKGVTRLHKKTPQAASLAVLTSPDIPSILVETGFISNPKEEKNLNWSTFRAQLAQSIFTGVKLHFKKAPPDGSLWAKLKRDKRTHKVRSGESLSLLSQRYNVRVSQLKSANNMRSDVVRIGQILTIPRI
ncbi:MAG: N-acetylmuramoyl-L-alanine amidase [Paraglaciecola sp.]|jgi:N-acetylmuramoyl-L-alanine amidase